MSICYTERLAETGVEPPVGCVGDSYDSAPAETVNGPFAAESLFPDLIRGNPPVRAIRCGP